MIGACRAGVQRRDRRGQITGRLAGLRTDRGESVRVLLLGHERARAAVRVGELDQPELLAGVDLEVLGELALMGGRYRERREQLDVHVGLPGGVLRMLDQPVAAEQLGKTGPVERPTRAGTATGTGDAHPQHGVRPPRAVGVAQGRIGVCQEQVANRRGLGRLEVGVVGRERGTGGARVSGERRGLVDERVVQLVEGAPGGEAKPDAERLSARPAGAQPARCRTAHAPLQLRFARIERVPDRWIPRKLVAGDRVQLEQPAQKRPRVVAGQVAALDERDRVRQIGEREPVREPRAMRALGGVRSRDHLAGRAASQPSAAT